MINIHILKEFLIQMIVDILWKRISEELSFTHISILQSPVTLMRPPIKSQNNRLSQCGPRRYMQEESHLGS